MRVGSISASISSTSGSNGAGGGSGQRSNGLDQRIAGGDGNASLGIAVGLGGSAAGGGVLRCFGHIVLRLTLYGLDFHEGLGKRRSIFHMTQIFPLRWQQPFRPSLLKHRAGAGGHRVAAWGMGLALALAGGVALVGPARLIAQIEGDRGIAPVVTTGDIEVDGIEVNTTGKTAQEARTNGWKVAYRLAWAKANGPALGDGEIESLVSGVVVEHEMIGPHRYIAKLGVVFDRGRAGQFVGPNGGMARRSAPMLVIPVLYSGGVDQVYEVRGPWQKAWAEYRTGASAIDYVRPSGSGGESLLITAGQVGRRSRLWWRTVLDQFGAADVIMPIARLERQWPGGPVRGTFTARYGPDNAELATFTLTATDEGAVPAMLQQALGRFDQIYTDALMRGALNPDATLSIDHAPIDPSLAALIAAGEAAEAADAAAAAAQAQAETAVPAIAAPVEAKPATAAYTVQFASPDARAVDGALAAVRTAQGVESAATSSIAIGGTSVMRVSYAGSLQELAAALRAKGWQVQVSGTALRIKR